MECFIDVIGISHQIKYVRANWPYLNGRSKFFGLFSHHNYVLIIVNLHVPKDQNNASQILPEDNIWIDSIVYSYSTK